MTERRGKRTIKTEYLLNKEVDRVLSALMPTNRLVCELILHTGLRIDDALSLKTSQLSSRMTIIEKKTKKKRRIGLPSDLLRRLQRQAGKEYVFQHRTKKNQHRTRQAVYMDIKRACKAFRFKTNAGTHSFRKVYAVDLLEKYGDIERVQRALNHSSLAVTYIYAMADKLLDERNRRRA